MKRLTLLRHAKSSWADRGLSDFDRPLNKRGKLAAPLMGHRLLKQNIIPDIIVSSPAKRAAQTVKIIAKILNYPKQKIFWNKDVYEAEIVTLISVIRNINPTVNHTLLCGHNPSLTALSNLLSCHTINNIPTCGVVSYKLDIPTWERLSDGIGELIVFDFPKNLVLS